MSTRRSPTVCRDCANKAETQSGAEDDPVKALKKNSVTVVRAIKAATVRGTVGPNGHHRTAFCTLKSRS